MESSTRHRTTAILQELEADDAPAVERILPLVYAELHALAHRQLRAERSGHTLNTTALVHEAYFRLVDDAQVTARGRAYFFGAAARAMRQVLVDYARRRSRAKRNRGAVPEPMTDDGVAIDTLADELIDLDRALRELAALNPRHAQVVECRFFGGLEIEETAAALGVSPRTVRYDWALARAWLREALDREPERPA